MSLGDIKNNNKTKTSPTFIPSWHVWHRLWCPEWWEPGEWSKEILPYYIQVNPANHWYGYFSGFWKNNNLPAEVFSVDNLNPGLSSWRFHKLLYAIHESNYKNNLYPSYLLFVIQSMLCTCLLFRWGCGGNQLDRKLDIMIPFYI